MQKEFNKFRRGPEPRPVEERFWEKVDRIGEDQCWLWKASQYKSGYGQFANEPAHRIAYKLASGPIGEGLEIDHLCRNKLCVNPAHLEAVPPRVNNLRGNSFAAVNARRTHCPSGHVLDLFNTYFYRGHRACRECRRHHRREWGRRARQSSSGIGG